MQIRDLNQKQFSRLSALLDEAVELDPTAREEWLARVERDEPQSAGVLRRLLEQQAAGADGWLETRDVLNRHLANLARETQSLVGRRLGPWRVVSLIGHGGMGSVWLAERADGLFTRQVALKLIHPALLGSGVSERFSREREILAGLDHPNIARLLDAGVADDGQPYLALQYIDGIPFTAYCDSCQLNVRQRLELFRQVLSAVQYAHANLVIHRDLKPSNILVTRDGHVQLLDFGIAKLLAQSGGETELTRLGGRVLTPDYASPEQVLGAQITTAADVYSLGVMLYELLTGERPYRLKHSSAGTLERAIVEVEASPPSRVGLTSEAAAARSTLPRKLARSLQGDLDTIVLQALKKTPAARYATVEALRRDLESYLAGEPVLARPDSVWYRVRKTLARNKLLAGAAAAVIVALSAGMVLALWQAHRAQAQAHRAEAVQGFLLDIFQTNSDRQQDPVAARELTARQLLDRGAQKIDRALADEPEIQADVLGTLADLYTAVGLDDQSAKIAWRRYQVLRQLYGPRDPRVAEQLLYCAEGVELLEGPQRALKLALEAKTMLDSAGDFRSARRGLLLKDIARFESRLTPVRSAQDAEATVAFFRRYDPHSEHVATAWSMVGRARNYAGDYRRGEAAYQAALAEVQAHGRDSLFQEFVTNNLGLADSQLPLGKIPRAEQALQTALAGSVQHNGSSHIDTVHAETRLGALLCQTGRPAEGLRLLRSAATKVRQDPDLGNNTNLVLAVRRNLGLGLIAAGRWEEADGELAFVLERQRRIRAPVMLARALADRAELDTVLGHYAQARTLLEEAEQNWRWAVGDDAPTPAIRNRFYLDEGALELAMANPEGALERYGRVLSLKATLQPALDTDDLRRRLGLSAVYLALNRIAEANQLAEAVVEEIELSSVRAYYPPLEADARLQLGEVQRRTGQTESARRSLETALHLRETDADPSNPWTAAIAVALAQCLLDVREVPTARALAARAEAAYAAHVAVGAQFTRPLEELRARLK
jgi:serine/threonine-protein kinase